MATVQQVEVSPCFWQRAVESIEPEMTYDFSHWVMVRCIPDDLTPQQTLLELGLPSDQSLMCRCAPDPRLARNYRIVLVCPDAEAASKEFDRLSSIRFRGFLLEVVMIADMLADLLELERKVPRIIRMDAAVAIPGIALHFAYPEYLMQQLCTVYGVIHRIRRVILQSGEPSHTVMVTFGCLTSAYAAEIALDGAPLHGRVIYANLATPLELRQESLLQVAQEFA